MNYVLVYCMLIKSLDSLAQATAQRFVAIWNICFYAVVWWHKLGEVENECTLHNSIVLAIFVPKIIKVNGNLTKFWRKQFW